MGRTGNTGLIEDVLREKREEILRIAEKHGAQNIRVFGSERLMYASDTPQWDMGWPESAALIWQREDLSLEAKKNILRNNAQRFYHLT